MPKMTAIGTVTSDKTNKTRRVEIPLVIRHPKYGKFIRRCTVCYVHDEENESQVGDSVEIRESRPRSKTKRWELVRVVSKSQTARVDQLMRGEGNEGATERRAKRPRRRGQSR